MPGFVSFALFNSEKWQIIMSASDLPDIDETYGGIFVGHFYDPDTQQNFQFQTHPTAKTNFTYWYNQAVATISKAIEYCATIAYKFTQDVGIDVGDF